MVETLAGSARVTGRHVKQSGGHGQYAIVVVEGEPGESGSGVVFEQRIVGGTVPSQFHGSVEKGIRSQAERGVSGDRPIVDVHVTLVDGKAHSVDSSDAAFQAAGALAVRELVAAAGTRVLEPWCEVYVTVPAEYVGAVMSDLSTRRGRVTGTESVGSGRSMVRADVPQVEITRYAVDLRSLSHGTGTFSRTYLRHEPMPAQLATKLQEEAAEH
jgi:elongation factor G